MAIKIRKKVSKTEEEEPQVEGTGEGEGLEDAELAPDDRLVTSGVNAAKWMTEHRKKIYIGVGVIITAVVAYAIIDSVITSNRLEEARSINVVLETFPDRAHLARTSALAGIRPPGCEGSLFDCQAKCDDQAKSGDPMAAQMRQLCVQMCSDSYTQCVAKEDSAAVDKAITLAESAVAEHGDSAVGGEAMLLLGTAAQRKGDFAKAEANLASAKGQLNDVDPANLFVLQAEATLLVDQGKTDEALSTLERIRKKDDQYFSAFALFEMGGLYEQKGENEKAANAYAELLGKYEDAGQVYAGEARKRLNMLVSDAEDRIQGFNTP